MRHLTGINLLIALVLSFFVSKGVQAMQQQPKVVPTPSVSAKPCVTKKPTIVKPQPAKQIRKEAPAWANDILNEENESNNESTNHRNNSHYNLPHFSVFNFLNSFFSKDTTLYKSTSFLPNKQGCYKINGAYRI